MAMFIVPSPAEDAIPPCSVCFDRQLHASAGDETMNIDNGKATGRRTMVPHKCVVKDHVTWHRRM